MKQFLFILFLSPLLMFGQENDHYVVAAQGDYFSNENIQISWTLGEVFTESALQTKADLTQGFHQSLLLESLLTQESFESDEEINEENDIFGSSQSKNSSFNVFPNPSSGIYYIDLEDQFDFMITMDVFDVSGKLVNSQTINQKLSELDLSTFARGLYTLVLWNTEKGQIGASRLIKQ